MSTLARFDQVRFNGAPSCGPVSAGTQARSITVLQNENATGFEKLFARRCGDFAPANSLEFDLVRELCDIEWRMDRLKGMETRALDAELSKLAEAGNTTIDPTWDAYAGLQQSSKLFEFCARQFRHLQKARVETLNTLFRVKKNAKLLAPPEEPVEPPQAETVNEAKLPVPPPPAALAPAPVLPNYGRFGLLREPLDHEDDELRDPDDDADSAT